jgi:hypothetical protein
LRAEATRDHSPVRTDRRLSFRAETQCEVGQAPASGTWRSIRNCRSRALSSFCAGDRADEGCAVREIGARPSPPIRRLGALGAMGLGARSGAGFCTRLCRADRRFEAQRVCACEPIAGTASSRNGSDLLCGLRAFCLSASAARCGPRDSACRGRRWVRRIGDQVVVARRGGHRALVGLLPSVGRQAAWFQLVVSVPVSVSVPVPVSVSVPVSVPVSTRRWRDRSGDDREWTLGGLWRRNGVGRPSRRVCRLLDWYRCRWNR